jgi:hypothetical protein
MSIRIRRAKSIAAAVLLVAAAGCTDTVVEPKSTVTEANIFTDASSYVKLVAKLYAGLAVTGQQGPFGNADIVSNDEGFMSYTRLLWNMNELPTDEAALAWGDLAIQELNQDIWATTNSFIQAMYYRIYFQVVLANEFLRQTTDAKLESRGHTSSTIKTDVAFYRAEARFLRALSYWHAIDFFGSVPLVTEADAVGGPTPAQASRVDIYNFIVQELTEIIPLLPAPGPSTYGRANQIAGHMLLAKVYLNAEVYTGTPEWSKALTETQAVIAGPYSLNPHWRYNFLADNNTSNEIIFPVTQDGRNTQNYGGTTFLIHAGCGGSIDNNSLGVNGCWWGFRMKPQAYENFFPPNQPAGDTARTSFFAGSTVEMANLLNFTDGVAAPKFSNVTSAGAAGADGEFPDTDYPMFRLADAYLMYAEAVVRGGGGSAGQALTYVNQLRQRVYGNASGDLTGPELTLDFILAERGRELMFEGQRRVDLIRFGKFTGSSYVWAWKGGTQAGGSLDPTRALYPIPASELVANPNLQQNPGY